MGPSYNAGHTIKDPLPAGTTFVSASAGCANNAGTVECTSSGLAAGADESFTIPVHVSAGYPWTQLSNTATISTANTPTANPTLSLHDALPIFAVNASADLKVTKTASDDPVTA